MNLKMYIKEITVNMVRMIIAICELKCDSILGIWETVIESKLFNMCKVTGMSMLLLSRYAIHIVIPNINEEICAVSGWNKANKIDVKKIDRITGILLFNLLNSIPLKISSSQIGPRITVNRKSAPVKIKPALASSTDFKI